MSARDLDAERDRIQRQIEALERSLGTDVSSIDVVVSGSSDGLDDDDSEDALDEDFEADEIALEDGSCRAEMCLQMNLVYQAVLQEKLQELELLITQNKEQQEELLWELAGRKTQRVGTLKPHSSNLAMGHFFKPYFKDKVTGVGPPANPEMMERSAHVVKTFKELISKRWRTTDSEELVKAVMSDTLQRMLQPKMLKLDYLQQKRDNSKSDTDKNILTKQIQEVERELDDINQLPEERLLGKRTDDHDWEKISNVNFEGIHNADRISKVWKNHLHPHNNKEPWEEDEIKKLQEIAEEHNFVNWELIAEELGTRRTAFQCLQQFQLNNKDFKKKEFTKEEDEILTHFVQRMRVGMHIPYHKVAYFMEGREPMQLLHRWSKSLDPSLKRGHWNKEEDELLLKAVEKYGEKDWYKIRFEVPGRSDVQCRERYLKGLHKDIKKGKWSNEEERKLIELTKKYGVGHWTKVSKEITHRTGSQCLSKWKYITGYFKARRKNKPVNMALRTRTRKTAPQKRSQNKVSRKRPQNTASKKIKVEEISEEEDDVNDTSSERSSIFTMSSSASISSCSSTSSGSVSSSSSSSSIISSSSSSSSISSSSSSSSSSSEDEDDLINMAEDSDNEERRAATKLLESVPDLDLWIPRKHSSDLPPKNFIINSATSKYSRVPHTKMRGRRGKFQFNTILKGIAYPPSTDIVTENAEDFLLKAKNSGHHILQISEDDVRRILRWNTIICQGKQGQPIHQTQTTPEGDASKRLDLRSTRMKNKTQVDRHLLVAVTPWVGNVFLPLLTHYKSPWEKQIHADVMRKKLSSMTITSTPIFTLLIQFFQINAGGCLQMIRLRKAQESQILQTVKQTTQQTTPADTISPTSISAHSLNAPQSQPLGSKEKSTKIPKSQTKRPAPQPAPKLKTVYELLKEKRMQQSRARRAAQNTLVVSPRIIVTPQIVVNQTSIPAGQNQTTILPVPSPTSQNDLLRAVPLPRCQVMPTNNTASSQILSASRECINRQGADKAVAQDTRNKCNSTPSIGSPCAVQAVPGSQGTASQQVPIQLLQSSVHSTTWILTPQGLVQIPIQALFPNVTHASINQNSAFSESSTIKAVDPSPIGASSNKVSAPPASSNSTVNQQKLPKSNGSIELENTAAQCVQPAKCPLPRVVPALSPPNTATQFTLTPKKYPVVKIAKVLPSNQPKAGTSNMANSQPLSPSQTTTQTPTTSTEKKILDFSLISLEDETSVKDWLQGKASGEMPTLKKNQAFLPPSACTLKTFSRILLQKKTLEEDAFKLVPRSDGGGEGNVNSKQEILSNLVEQRLQDNPAYNLLKQRFLSAFTFSGLLAVFIPPTSKLPKSGVNSEVKDEDKVIDMDVNGSYSDNCTDGHPGGKSPGPTARSPPHEGETLNSDGQWNPANTESENDADNTGRRVTRRMAYCRSET